MFPGQATEPRRGGFPLEPPPPWSRCTRSFNVLHHSEVEVKKRIEPRYPKTAKEANLGDQRCLAKVYIDETGTPYKVLVENCPKVFHASTREAILKWRWYPPKVGKQKVKAQITIGITYKVR